jgi:hypothetical protein
MMAVGVFSVFDAESNRQPRQRRRSEFFSFQIDFVTAVQATTQAANFTATETPAFAHRPTR